MLQASFRATAAHYMVDAARLFSTDNPKASKAAAYGWHNAIHYMAHSTTAGVGNLCPSASAGCITICLGEHSGQAAIHAAGKDSQAITARKRRARMFMKDRAAYLAIIDAAIWRAKREARRLKLELCVRLNGSTDIPLLVDTAARNHPYVQFTDYTKLVSRALAHAAGKLPRNVSVTFSRSETNEDDCRRVLAAGGNVAAVFAGALPATYLGAPVINGDLHDLRHLDPRGVVVGLSPKGNAAKRDRSGFVVRS